MRPIEIVSPDFLLLATLTLAVYYLIPPRAQAVWLLLVSYIFYATWNPLFPFVLFIVTVMNYHLARRIEETKSRPLLIAGVVINAGSLILLKIITGPYGENLMSRTGLTGILLPVGFSFYVLQIVSYLIDVQRGQIESEKQFSHFALYLAYFPKLLAGPIERAKFFLPQLKRERMVDASGEKNRHSGSFIPPSTG
jgi:D-alanyl-lipoteichoic acid acyltransferase DltB (MBOAT superfamily)